MKIIKKITNRDDEALNKYFNELKFKILTSDEELELFDKYKHNNDEIAKEKLIKANLRFVVSCAKKYQSNSSNLSLGDLIGFGNIGLCNAIDRFDQTKGFKFISYAVWYIEQQILNNLEKNQSTLTIPRHHNRILFKINKEIDKFNNINQRNPLMEELLEMNLIDNNEYDVYKGSLKNKNKINLNDVVKNGNDIGDLSYCDVISNNESDVDDFINNNHNEYIIKQLFKNCNLTPEQVIILTNAFGINCEAKNIENISKMLNLNIQKTKMLYNSAIFKLKRKKQFLTL